MEVRKRIVQHGASIRDRVLETLPHDYEMLVEQVKSISRIYRNDVDLLIKNLSNIKNLDILVIYTILLSIINKYKVLSYEELAKLSQLYGEIDFFSASRVRKVLENAGFGRETANEIISNVLRSLNVITSRHKTLYEWVAKQRKMSKFEEEVRTLIFRNEGGNRVGRGVKLLLRLYIHQSNIPIAARIAYTNEVKKYIPHGDIYTTYVTLRSNAFEDVNSLTAERLKARVARSVLGGLREGKYREVTVRLESVRGLIRHVAKISEDPVLYERGAYDIGVKYCRDLKCSQCPIRDVCRQHGFIKVK